MKHEDLIRRLRGQHQPWRPDCTVLPSGLVVDTDFLRRVTDQIMLSEIFGIRTGDSFTRTLMRDGYASLGDATTLTINKAMTTA